MVRTTKEPRSCQAGAPISLWHRVARCAPRLSAGHAWRLTMPVLVYDDHAPASP